MGEPGEAHYALITKAIADARMVPFLGAGTSLCGRPPRTRFERGKYLPSATELTEYLSQAYPPDEPRELLRVAAVRLRGARAISCRRVQQAQAQGAHPH